jgi:tyrosine-protein phosphatase YwqE
VIWIVVPLLVFALFGLYVRRAAEKIRAEDGRPHVTVKLKLAGGGMATLEEIRLRQSIEAAIEERGIGTITDTASGDGYATIDVAVAEVARATEQINELLREKGLAAPVVTAVPR